MSELEERVLLLEEAVAGMCRVLTTRSIHLSKLGGKADTSELASILNDVALILGKAVAECERRFA